MSKNTALFFDCEESLILSPNCQAGLILQGRLYNDLVCPGASLGCSAEFGFQSAYAIGDAELCVATTAAERRQARQKRMDTIQRLQRILLQPNGHERASLIVNLLCHWFGRVEARQMPASLVATLVNVSCETLEQAWRRYTESLVDPVNEPCLSNTYLSWQSLVDRYSEHIQSCLGRERPSRGRFNVERLLHSALMSGKLTSDSERVIDQAFGGQTLTDREIDLLVTLKDAIAAGAVKPISSSHQAVEARSKSAYRIFCSLP